MIDLAPATGMLAMGLAGSVHCASMCGAVFGACAQGGRGGARVLPTVALHAGRVASYSLLGAATGAAGAMIDWGAGALALPRVAAIVAGAVMVGLALEQLGVFGWLKGRMAWTPAEATARERLGVAPGSDPSPGLFTRLLGRALRSPGGAGLFAVGAALGILPCGLLYGAAALAAATADPVRGATLMACFALGGALPLVALGQVFRWLWGRGAGGMVNRVAAAIVLVLGLGTMTGRVGGNPGLSNHSHHLHGGQSGAASQSLPGAPESAADGVVTGAPHMGHDHGEPQAQDPHRPVHDHGSPDGTVQDHGSPDKPVHDNPKHDHQGHAGHSH